METTKVLIISSGPAGYTAAIYASRANLQPILYEGIEPGGQLTTTTEIENFPGYPDGVDGNRMMADLRRQAERFGADLRTGTVTKIDLSSRPFHAIVDGTAELAAEAVIIATGASAKYLGLPSETKFRGQGVSACATCDGFFYRKKDVAVVGGGDTACEEATYLASLCRKVYMIVRKPFLRASKAMQQRVMQTPNIEVLFEHNTAEVLGDETGVTGALLRKTDGSERRIEISGFFLAIGHHPNTELFADQLELDAEGYIRTEPGTSKTSVEGVFAAGDVTGFSMLAHTASREGEVVVNNLTGRPDVMRYNAIPGVVYTNPEVAGVGLTEEQAKKEGIEYRIAKLPMAYAGRFVAENEGGSGLCKVLVGAKYGEVLGVHMLGNPCSEIIYGACMAIEQEMTLKEMQEVVFPHPTVSEIFKETIFAF